MPVLLRGFRPEAGKALAAVRGDFIQVFAGSFPPGFALFPDRDAKGVFLSGAEENGVHQLVVANQRPGIRCDRGGLAQHLAGFQHLDAGH